MNKIKKFDTSRKKITTLKILLCELSQRLENGRCYLMGVKPSELTAEDALEAFGYGRNGFESF